MAVQALLLNPEARMAKRTTKKATNKAPKKKNPTTNKPKPRRPPPPKKTPRRRKRKRNPSIGAHLVTAAKAVGGALAGAVAGGGLFYVVKDADINPAIPGAVAMVGGGALAALQPLDATAAIAAGGMMAALGAANVIYGVLGRKAENVAPEVDERTMLPTTGLTRASMPESPAVKGIEVPRALGSGADPYLNGSYESAYDATYDGIEVPAYLERD